MEYTKSDARRLVNQIKIEEAYKVNLTKEEIEEAKKTLRYYKDTGTKLVEYFDELNEMYDMKDGTVHGLKLGVNLIDDCIGLMKNKELMVLGGAPSAGKSLIATNVMANLIQSGKNVIYVSLEMGFGAVFERLAAIIDKINPCFFSGKIEDKKTIEVMKNKVTDFAVKMSQNKHWQILTMDDFEKPTCENIMATCKALAKHLKWNKIDLVIIDYLQYIPTENNKTEYESVNDAVSQLKTFIVTEKIPVLALSSLSNEGALKGSSNIKFTADFVMMLNFKSDDDHNERVLAFTKNRRGACKMESLFIGQYLNLIEEGK